jgi:hypothetical protein
MQEIAFVNRAVCETTGYTALHDGGRIVGRNKKPPE